MHQLRSAIAPKIVSLAALVAMSVVGSAARAQAAGEDVRIELDSGALEGTLVDKLPNGYLVRVGGKTQVVPYAKVRSIAKVGQSASPAAPPPPSPVPSAAPSAAPAPEAAAAPPAPVAPPAAATPPPPSTASAPPLPTWARPLPPPPPPKERRSPGMAAAGTALTALGLVGLVGGVVLVPVGSALKADNTCHDPGGGLTFDCEYGPGSTMVTAGIVSLVSGGVLLAGGIPLMAIGSQHVERAAPSGPGATAARRATSLRWSF